MVSSFSPGLELSSTPIRSGVLVQTYGLLFIALILTTVGVVVGATIALPLVTSGWIFALFIAELAIIWTAPTWSRSSPLNIVLFLLFPLFSGITLTPIILSVLVGYANGVTILLNALIAVSLLVASSALLAATSRTDLGGVWGRFLLQSLLGLIVFTILQMFFPSLRGQGIDLFFSGAGIIIFSLFLAVDIQRLHSRADGQSPFLLAISIYLDIFNLFLFVIRFMLALSGNRR